MQDFFCESPKKMHYKELASRADYFKTEAEGVHTMCELMEKFGEKKLEEGRIESARRTATALLALGKLTVSQIADATQLSLEEVKRLSGATGA